MRSDSFIAKAFHLAHVGAFDAQKGGWPVTPRCMKVPLVIDMRVARAKMVGACRTNTAWRFFAGFRQELEIRHFGFATRQRIDGP